MLTYYLELAGRGLCRAPLITLLSVVALALGIGATVTASSVTRLVAGNPLPERADSLYQVRMETTGLTSVSIGRKMFGPEAITWHDARELEQARPAVLQSVVVNTGEMAIDVAGTETSIQVRGLQVQSPFFQMFAVPFAAGQAWSRAEDQAASPVVVISQNLARRLFQEGNAVGRSLQIEGHSYRVVGVTKPWQPYPHFYGLNLCVYACDAEEVFIPVSTARAQSVPLYVQIAGGNIPLACSQGEKPVDAARCPYLQLWAMLPTTEGRKDYADMLRRYAAQQVKSGRFELKSTNAVGLSGIGQVLQARQVVPFGAKFAVWVAFVFLLVCLINVAGLLLTRFMRSYRELAIRRALGATRGAIFTQCLLEAGTLGLLGGLLAVPLVWLGLWLVQQQPTQYAGIIAMDVYAVVALLVMALACGLAIGVVPAWRATTIAPGLQVKEL